MLTIPRGRRLQPFLSESLGDQKHSRSKTFSFMEIALRVYTEVKQFFKDTMAETFQIGSHANINWLEDFGGSKNFGGRTRESLKLCTLC